MNRRTFLRLIGLSSVVGPAVVNAASTPTVGVAAEFTLKGWVVPIPFSGFVQRGDGIERLAHGTIYDHGGTLFVADHA